MTKPNSKSLRFRISNVSPRYASSLAALKQFEHLWRELLRNCLRTKVWNKLRDKWIKRS